jgi:16S rRNA processing protein RimM
MSGSSSASGSRPSMSEVVVGVVGKPFGVQGGVYVRPDPDLDHDFPQGARYALDDGRRLTVAESHVHGNRLLVRFEGVNDRFAAEALRGAVLSVPREEVRLDSDALWAADLVGRDVRDPEGALLGVVEGFLDGPAHDYIVVARPDGGEVMIPLVEAFVDLGGEAVVVRTIPGLLD